MSTYTLDQIKEAFWTEFHESGERWFNYLGTDKENQESTQLTWEDFRMELDRIKKEKEKDVFEDFPKEIRSRLREIWLTVSREMMVREVMKMPMRSKGYDISEGMERTEAMQDFLDGFTEKAFGRKMRPDQCVTCGSLDVKAEDFRDDLSRKEFSISRMCQKCQDEVFGA